MNNCPHLKGTKPCRRGADCHFYEQGDCWFYHSPQKDRRQKQRAEKIKERQREMQRQRQRQKLNRQRKEREEQEERQMLRQRRRRIRQREERQQQEERQRLHHLRIRSLMENLRLQRNSKNDHDFEWYLSKNKSFNALEISEEKIHQLDQCIICFSSFWDHKDHLRQEYGPFFKNSLKQQQRLSNSCHFVPLGSQNSIQLFSELQTTLKLSSLISKKKLQSKLKQCLDSKKYLEMELTELFCKHTFHKECIKKWLLKNPKCPVCRKNFKEHEEYKKFQQQQKEEKKVEKNEERKPLLSNIPIISSSSLLDLSF